MIEIKKLTVCYQTQSELVTALADINLKLLPCETIGLWGHSGCGKTTLMKAIFSLPIDEPGIVDGNIMFNNASISPDIDDYRTFENNKTISKNCYGYYKRHRRLTRNLLGISFRAIFQEPIYNFEPEVRLETQFDQAFKRFASVDKNEKLKDEFCQYLNKLDLDYNSIKSKFNLELSGGECQRIMFALNMVGEPVFLFADEPTTAMDLNTRMKVHEILKEKQTKTGMSVILASHNKKEILSLADKIIIIYNGYIVEKGDLSVFQITEKNESRHPYTNRLVAISEAEDTITNNKIINQGTILNDRCPYLNECNLCYDNENLKEKCLNKRPPFFKVNDNHEIACWHYENR